MAPALLPAPPGSVWACSGGADAISASRDVMAACHDMAHAEEAAEAERGSGFMQALGAFASMVTTPEEKKSLGGKEVPWSSEAANGAAEEDFGAVQVRLAREKIVRERMQLLLGCTLQDPELAWLIGQAAGIPATFHYGTTAREHGRAMRGALPLLYASAVPHIYVCGGASVFCGVLQTANRFNICDGTWDMIHPMTMARRLCAAAVSGGCLYIFGGEYEEVPLWYSEGGGRRYHQLETAECFDPFKGVWQVLPPMPTARAGCAAAAIGGLIYVFCGRIGEHVRPTNERFDTNCGRWERLPDVPTARSGCSAAALLGALYVIGGKGVQGQILNSVERFDQSVGRWQRLPPMFTPRSACVSGTLGGKLYVAGGFDGIEGVNVFERFDPAIGLWEPQAQMTTWRIGAAAAVAGGKFYVLGGKNGGENALIGEVFDPGTGTWISLPPMPERHVYCAGAALVGCL
mmetsp:Transcript_23843/g.43380  ORF Transcript_23843/g.43380 Transcript_23843/m.43380 type:complete len:461 (-) Transcript_23843:48-1430(-)